MSKSHKRQLIFSIVGVLLVLGFLFPRPRTDAYYSEVVTATLLPKGSEDARGRPLEGPSKKPYWKFTLPRGYLSSRLTQSQSGYLEFDVLYPTMEHFVPSKRATWFEKNPSGAWGPHVQDVLRVFVEFYIQGENDAGSQAFRAIENSHLLVEPPAELAAKVSGLRVFRSNSDRDKPLDLGKSALVYQQADGRLIVVSCGYCSAKTTWQNRIRVEYHFPRSRLDEMADIDLAIQRLINSFQPTLVQ